MKKQIKNRSICSKLTLAYLLGALAVLMIWVTLSYSSKPVVHSGSKKTATKIKETHSIEISSLIGKKKQTNPTSSFVRSAMDQPKADQPVAPPTRIQKSIQEVLQSNDPYNETLNFINAKNGDSDRETRLALLREVAKAGRVDPESMDRLASGEFFSGLVVEVEANRTSSQAAAHLAEVFDVMVSARYEADMKRGFGEAESTDKLVKDLVQFLNRYPDDDVAEMLFAKLDVQYPEMSLREILVRTQ